MEIRQLRTFNTLAEYGSFYKAANVTRFAQSTVSAQIRALDEEPGKRLFERLGRGILFLRMLATACINMPVK